MVQEIKFRVWNKELNKFDYFNFNNIFQYQQTFQYHLIEGNKFEQFTGYVDIDKTEIFEGDVLRFIDKWEWYKGKYGIKMYFADNERKKELQAQYDAEPYEERIVDDIRDEWLNSSEIQRYRKVIGNIYQNPELLKQNAKV